MDENKSIQLKLRVSENELEQIQNNAKACNKTVSAFMRENALNFCVLHWDYECIEKHSNNIVALRNSINQLIYTIRKTGEYVPADLEYILKKMNQISKLENEFYHLMLDEKEQKRKDIKTEIRKIVRRKLADDVKKTSNS